MNCKVCGKEIVKDPGAKLPGLEEAIQKYRQMCGIRCLYRTIDREIEEIAKYVRAKETWRKLREEDARKSKEFFASKEWRELRYRVLSSQGRVCTLCGATKESGAMLHVDHIKPRSKFPDLWLEESNLQVLCEDCNLGKSNKYFHDHRPKYIPEYVERFVKEDEQEESCQH